MNAFSLFKSVWSWICNVFSWQTWSNIVTSEFWNQYQSRKIISTLWYYKLLLNQSTSLVTIHSHNSIIHQNFKSIELFSGPASIWGIDSIWISDFILGCQKTKLIPIVKFGCRLSRYDIVTFLPQFENPLCDIHGTKTTVIRMHLF